VDPRSRPSLAIKIRLLVLTAIFKCFHHDSVARCEDHAGNSSRSRSLRCVQVRDHVLKQGADRLCMF
jgi:hypothetical protein